MDLESFRRAVSCLIDELVDELGQTPGWSKVRQRGPAPILADSEVLSIEVIGEFLGLDQDVAIIP